MPRDRNLAEKDPAKFAALLIERLQKVKNDHDSAEKVMQSINQTKVCGRINNYTEIVLWHWLTQIYGDMLSENHEYLEFTDSLAVCPFPPVQNVSNED